MSFNQNSDHAASLKLPPNEKAIDPALLWEKIELAANEAVTHEPVLAHALNELVLEQGDLGAAVCVCLSRKLHRSELPRKAIEPIMRELLQAHPSLVEDMAQDIVAIVERDAACHSPLVPLLHFKGFHAISTHRLANALWLSGRRELALFLQSISSEVFSTDIHPAAKIGSGILMDHATSCVVGETAVIENDVSILHEVTLGGTGKASGLRHPVVRSGVMIGAGSKILGRVEIGRCAKIGAGSVVLNDVPEHVTVAGVPATIVGESREGSPALQMDQSLRCRKSQ